MTEVMIRLRAIFTWTVDGHQHSEPVNLERLRSLVDSLARFDLSISDS